MKKENKIIIIAAIIIVIVLGVVVLLVTNQKKDLTSKANNIIGETDITKKSYGYPLISLVNENNMEIELSAGIYRYGDIDQDGIIDENDIEALEIMIDTEKVGFSEGQVSLADVNEDSKIDENDIKMFKEYLDKHPSTKYDIKSTELTYCLNDKADSASCIWQTSPKFKVKEKKNYYAFVKQNGTTRISSVKKIEKTVFDKPEKM